MISQETIDELTERMKKHGTWRDLSVVVLTASELQQLLEAAKIVRDLLSKRKRTRK